MRNKHWEKETVFTQLTNRLTNQPPPLAELFLRSQQTRNSPPATELEGILVCLVP